ncbi:conserved hypothetical Ustilaginaceae-specific protein [Sporisorium reilianum SRZ2]|uniref:Conserved hypothetical Ustilaginaceae-specific protein n=1 Tax=Sporisorium reilianum (strain SRZ2) TaxID=999809 RepID=E6ZZI2_SPORE|nr:conserved hypothetical Ustilaginaceae-specific protein [Sporisorium reilianum SRZ2]
MVIALFSVAVLSVTCSVAVKPPPMSQAEQEFHRQSLVAYFGAYPDDQHGNTFIDYYSHLLGGHRTLEQDALAHAHLDGNGPFYFNSQQEGTRLFLATRVSGTSRLGKRWNLRQWIHDRPSNYDAHLSWRVDHQGPKLLRLDIWPEGSNPAVRMTMQEAMDHLRLPPA